MKEFIGALSTYQATETLTVPAKELIVRNGSESRDLFVVVAGSALILRDNPNGVTGPPKAAFRIADHGKIIGSELLGGSKVYEYSAKALNECEVLRIPLSTFKQAMRYIPEVVLPVLNSLAEDLSYSYRRISEMRMPVTKTVARAILEFSNHLGQDLSIINEEDIAALVNVSKTTVSRIVAKYKRAGALNPKLRRIEILDRPLLEEIAKPTPKRTLKQPRH